MNAHVIPAVPQLWPALPLSRRGLLFLIVLAFHAVLLAWALSARTPMPAVMVPLPVSVRLIQEASVIKPQLLPAPLVPPVPQPPRAIKPPQPRMPAPLPASVTPSSAPILAAAPSTKASSDFAVAEPRPAVANPVAAPAPVPSLAQARFDADYLHNPKPAYPPLSRRLGEEGKVLLKVSVTAQGTAEQVEVHKSSGFSRLDAAARDAVQRWRFVPARRGDEPVAASVLVPITFALEG
ncbi:MAG: energy transducer TonB [Betaproteobacteria bacterium]|nr:energy transducer TonB [Betaproteobacteria bacterium]